MHTPKSFVVGDKQFDFKWIFECDNLDVLRVRNAENVLCMLPSSRKITLEEHEGFIKNYPKLPRIDFMIIHNDSCVGGVNVCSNKEGLEIGKYIGDNKYLGSGIAKAAMVAFIQFLSEFFLGCILVSRTKISNKINIALNEKLGFLKDENNTDGFVLMRLELH